MSDQLPSTNAEILGQVGTVKYEVNAARDEDGREHLKQALVEALDLAAALPDSEGVDLREQLENALTASEDERGYFLNEAAELLEGIKKQVSPSKSATAGEGEDSVMQSVDLPLDTPTLKRIEILVDEDKHKAIESVTDWIDWAIRERLTKVNRDLATTTNVTYEMPEETFEHAMLDHQWRELQCPEDREVDVVDTLYEYTGGGGLRFVNREGEEFDVPDDGVYEGGSFTRDSDEPEEDPMQQ
ncbi:hypothetical protein ACFQE1_03735 [Halobium palmae]|uniref:Uncharacterized protein n=1 Tax=Halobium palmae TaxID=1776492 RepID=A0ABD5RW87_9EURY